MVLKRSGCLLKRDSVFRILCQHREDEKKSREQAESTFHKNNPDFVWKQTGVQNTTGKNLSGQQSATKVKYYFIRDR